VILRNRRCGLVSAIVAALRFSTDEGMPKLLLVTSTRLAEGKSSSALAIAQNPPADLLSTGWIRKIIGEAKEGFDPPARRGGRERPFRDRKWQDPHSSCD
jgi:hypothetical protein